MELITSTWEGASATRTGHTSLKFDSKAATGMGSSLVVNPRGMHARGRGPAATIGRRRRLRIARSHRQGRHGRRLFRPPGLGRSPGRGQDDPPAAWPADAERREKFLSEAVVTGDLDHPNIVPIYELGTNEDNALFYSMKRVQGTPWSKVHRREERWTENLEILMKVADAVAFAHANGVVHRDLKPENVMLGDFGEVLVMDWGLALATASFRHADFVTGPDSMGGTPAYMAPEMATGPFELIGPASDIYLLGALLFEIVTGLPPHNGDDGRGLPVGRGAERNPAHRRVGRADRHRLSGDGHRAGRSLSPACRISSGDSRVSLALRKHHAGRRGPTHELAQAKATGRLSKLCPGAVRLRRSPGAVGWQRTGQCRHLRSASWPTPKRQDKGRLRAGPVAVGRRRSAARRLRAAA